MPGIVVRLDEHGRHAVYRDDLLLMDGLDMADAENFAAFFRASERVTGGIGVRSPPTAERSLARRGGVIARTAQAGFAQASKRGLPGAADRV